MRYNGRVKVLVVIPAHNEEEIIIPFVREVEQVLPDFDYVVVNDGSTDRTKLLLEYNNINHLTLPVNTGLTVATRVGFEHAYQNNYDYVVKIDGDGQHNPHTVHYMLQTMRAHNYDVVQISRFMTQHRSWFSVRTLASRFVSVVAWITTGRYLTDPTNGCHMYNRKLIERYHFDTNLGPEPDTLCYLIKDKYKYCQIPAEVRKRQTGRSIFTLHPGAPLFTWSKFVFQFCWCKLFVANNTNALWKKRRFFHPK